MLLRSSDALVPEDTNGTYDAYLRDRQRGTVERVSLTAGGGQLAGYSEPLAMTPDASKFLFLTQHIDGSPGGSSDLKLFLFDRAAGTVEEMSGGLAATGDAWGASIDDAGRFVAFSALGLGIVPLPPGVTTAGYLRDLVTGEVTAFSHPNDAWVHVVSTSISGNGRYVSFHCKHPLNSGQQVFRYDRVLGTYDLASIGPAGETLLDAIEWQSISADGRTIAFNTIDDSIAPFDTNGFPDVVVRRFGSGIEGDVNADGYVDAFDLAELLGAWGSTSQASDLNGDGSVDATDLAIVLGAWTGG